MRQRQKLADEIKSGLKYLEKRKFNSNGSNPPKIGFLYPTLRFNCSHAGYPDFKTIRKNNIDSKKVGCLRNFSITADGQVLFNNNHHEHCEECPISEPLKDFMNNVQNLSELEVKWSETISNLHLNDPSLTAPQIKIQVKELIKSELGEATVVPTQYLRRIYNKGISLSHNGIEPPASFERLISDLKEKKLENLRVKDVEHRIKRDTNGTITALHFSLPQLYPSEDQMPPIFMADVTHNVTPAASGWNKLSSINVITMGREVHNLVSSLIQSENEATFHSELDFLVSLFPEIENSPVVFLVDGDNGRINAIQARLPKATIHLCLW